MHEPTTLSSHNRRFAVLVLHEKVALAAARQCYRNAEVRGSGAITSIEIEHGRVDVGTGEFN